MSNENKNNGGRNSSEEKKSTRFPEKFPFWARLKIEKKRTTLVIDECETINKKKKREEKGFVHREATHTYKPEYQKVDPNPDKDDKKPMYLKRPKKLPQVLFGPHNKQLDMPEALRRQYEKNNRKPDKKGK